jgi:sec-independent protein translocase protein TatA
MPSGSEWIIVILVVVVIFGASRLPLLGRNLGQGIKEFRKGVKEARTDDRPEADAKQAPPPLEPPSPPPAQEGDGQPGRIADRRD